MLKTEQVVNKIIEALEDNKAHRIVKIDLRKIENMELPARILQG